LDAEPDFAGVRFLSSLAGEFPAKLRFNGCICEEGQEAEAYAEGLPANDFMGSRLCP
jgi:hypothetical protein